MSAELDLMGHVSALREALRQNREARKEYEKDTGNVLLEARWRLSQQRYFDSRLKFDQAVDEAIGLFKDED